MGKKGKMVKRVKGYLSRMGALPAGKVPHLRSIWGSVAPARGLKKAGSKALQVAAKDSRISL